MHRLLKGALAFRDHVFCSQRELFVKLVEGQQPQALFITCSDSRISPSLITQTAPGDMFVMRNAGNIVPPAGAGGGEAATIEYAIKVLGIRNIIVCGHYHCGAMQALLPGTNLDDMPQVASFLKHAEATRAFVTPPETEAERKKALITLVEANVLLQIEHLCTHPSVATALAREELDIHAWTYRFETGDIFSFDLASARFLPLTDLSKAGEANGTTGGVAHGLRQRPMIRALKEVE